MNQVVNLNAPSRIMRPDQNTANELDLSDVNSYKKKAKGSQTVKGIYLVVFFYPIARKALPFVIRASDLLLTRSFTRTQCLSVFCYTLGSNLNTNGGRMVYYYNFIITDPEI